MIIIRINLDFLRKNLNSFSESGFSGVSNGQMQKMIIAETNVTTNKIFWKSYCFERRITIIDEIIDRVDIISHLVSVDAWYPPAYLLMNWNAI